MNKKISIALLGVLVLVLLGTGCVDQAQNGTTTPVKLGWLGPLTGDVSSVGTADKDGMALAVKEINAAGGINGQLIEVVYEDGACDAKIASNAGNKLINIDKVVAIIGGLCTGETMTVAPVAEQNKVIMISPGSTAPSVTNGGDYIFRVVPSDNFQGKYAAEFIYNALGKRKAAVLYGMIDYTEAIAKVFSDEFKKLGGEVVVTDSFLKDSRDLKTQLTKIKDSGADILYFSSYTEAGVIGLKQAQELKIEAQIFGIEAFDDPKFRTAPGSDGVLYTLPFSPSNDAFKIKYLTETARKDMPVYVSQTYDAMNILADVMKEVGTDPEAIKNALYKVQDYDGVSGKIGFDKNGDMLSADYVIMEMRNGDTSQYKNQ